MKEKTFFYDLRTYMVFVVMMILSFSCCPEEYYLLPVVVIEPADNVKLTSATMVALVVPNEDGTEVSFEFKPTSSENWQVKAMSLTYGGQDYTKLTSDLSGLEVGTEYSFRVKASNAAGQVVSGISTFCTYAISDIDGNLYHTVKIGNQTWLRENLAVTHYKNGDPIANVTDPVAWGNLTTGAYCWYDSNPKLGEVYGALYNWYTTADPRGLAIEGWHVPTDEEWIGLITSLGEPGDPFWGQITAYPKLMEAGYAHWKVPTIVSPATGKIILATNSSGFTALPSGTISDPVTGKFVFMNLGEEAIFWSSSLFGPGAVAMRIYIDHWTVETGVIFNQTFGFSIRLVKDAK